MYIFWDNSNIHISGLRVMKEKEPTQQQELFRTDFNNLFDLVRKKEQWMQHIYLVVYPLQIMLYGII